MKKLLSLLLAALMVVCLLPTAAFAEEFGDGDKGSIPMKMTVESPVLHTVSVSASQAEGGSVSGGGTYDDGTSVTVTAAPSSGYIFTGWLENGEKVENAGASYTFTVTADRTLTAGFEQAKGTPVHLFLPSSPNFNIEAVDAPVSLNFNPGEMVTVTAVPKHGGVRFAGWLERNYDEENPNPGKTLVCTDTSYSFNIEHDTHLVIDYNEVQTVFFWPGKGSDGDFFFETSIYANELDRDRDYILYTSEGPDDLKFHFPPADCFPAPENMVFDCWEVDGGGYEAGSVQTVIGSGANPAFAADEITITAKWKDADPDVLHCVISIPAQIDIPYKQEFTPVKWSVDSLELGAYSAVEVTFYDGTFQSQQGDITPYTVQDIAEAEDAHSYRYKMRRPEEHTIQIHIAAEDWAIAAPGEYTATLQFVVTGLD